MVYLSKGTLIQLMDSFSFSDDSYIWVGTLLFLLLVGTRLGSNAHHITIMHSLPKRDASIHPFIHPIEKSNLRFIHPSIHPSNRKIQFEIHSFIHPSIHPSIPLGELIFIWVPSILAKTLPHEWGFCFPFLPLNSEVESLNHVVLSRFYTQFQFLNFFLK